MQIIKSSYQIEPINSNIILLNVAKAGATCYKNETKIVTVDDAKKFIKMIISNGHESVLEHEKVTVRVICDRGVTHEIVRHRIASYSQESTRYCNYANDKFCNEITVIDIGEHLHKAMIDKGKSHDYASFVVDEWQEAMMHAESTYLEMIDRGVSPELARSVLPNSLKTEIVITMNLREWRHFFKLRAVSKRAHPQLREITVPMLKDFQKLIPVVFDDLIIDK